LFEQAGEYLETLKGDNRWAEIATFYAEGVRADYQGRFQRHAWQIKYIMRHLMKRLNGVRAPAHPGGMMPGRRSGSYFS